LDAEVLHLWHGSPRTAISVVYLSRMGDVITSDFDEMVSYTEARPEGAPTYEEDRYWSTEKEKIN
jgi:hypothetical protein